MTLKGDVVAPPFPFPPLFTFLKLTRILQTASACLMQYVPYSLPSFYRVIGFAFPFLLRLDRVQGVLIYFTHSFLPTEPSEHRSLLPVPPPTLGI